MNSFSCGSGLTMLKDLYLLEAHTEIFLDGMMCDIWVCFRITRERGSG